jgi:Tfp pilus assembly protein PilF
LRALIAAARADPRRRREQVMRSSRGRWVVALACLVSLGGCATSTRLGDLLHPAADDAATSALAQASPVADPDTTGSIGAGASAAADAALPGDPGDDLKLGQKQYRAGNFDLAERHFGRAAETNPRDPEAWVGLAAVYDRQRRFDLADRAYDQVLAIVGPTAELLNNRGYSYLLRGDYPRARSTLLAAAAQDPKNPYIKNNLALLDKSSRSRKAVQ